MRRVGQSRRRDSNEARIVQALTQCGAHGCTMMALFSGACYAFSVVVLLVAAFVDTRRGEWRWVALEVGLAAVNAYAASRMLRDQR